MTLPDDVLIDIFLLLPPHPSCLLRASLVCKHWHSLILDNRFLHRFQALHGLPVLGVFTNSTRIPRFLPVGDPPNRVAAASFSLPDIHWHVLGCRHSHILLIGSTWNQLLVWNPINGHERLISAPPDVDPRFNYGHVPESNAAVVCAANHADHGYCHSCPFFVIWVFTTTRYAYATRYSSESRSWEMMASSPIPSDVDFRPSILVRNILYWPLKSKYILAFELVTHRLYHIECPPETHDIYRRNVHMMKTEDGGLGLAAVTKFNLRLWAWDTDVKGVTGWVLRRIIELDKFLPLELLSLPSMDNRPCGRPPVRILGLVEDDDLVFIWTKTGVFTVQLKTMKHKKVFEADVSASVYPYTGFRIAGAVAHDGGNVAAE
ncbi:hypothetical protein SEVIR_9G293900v4 [Setaria viridis]|uniref:F-box domain-containing protein n=1 Tax=Setaria viridis TaxID=4556 RepID=A0A4U6T177_SETVI|nr:hypothetical protein SEVIR_9G293900v2 [Setaria viridis]TKV94425.1 hypothetical protein SEVIR_9G293900v2 [Setaria viridis]